MTFKKIAVFLLVFIASASLLILGIKGKSGDPVFYQSEVQTDKNIGGPFESSSSNSRFALVESIAKERTFFFNEERAYFAAPDLVSYNGTFFSIFTPGVSFLGVPLYLLGAKIGFAQLATYSLNIIAGLLNIFLVYKLSRKLGAGAYSSLFSGTAFVFATHALVYAFTLSQHHISTALILFAILNAIGKRTLVKDITLGAAFGLGILMDIPNVFMMAPVILYAFSRSIKVEDLGEKTKLVVKLTVLSFLIGVIPFLATFSWYNYKLTGSYLKIGQLIGRSDFPVKEENKATLVIDQESSELRLLEVPFNPRRMLEGLPLLIASNERGILFYSPITAFGIAGLILAVKSKNQQQKTASTLASSVIFSNLLIYGMFGDPWGGWSFGPRYLVPTAAILCAGIGPIIERFKRKIIFLILLALITTYSIFVNTLGALTSTQVPPKVEAQALQNPIPHTYIYNWHLTENKFSGSLIYNLYFSNIIPAQIYLLLFSSLSLFFMVLIFSAAYKEKPIIDK
ncbi:MAG: glycosyltransferase family 39 protein [Candidatus Curtissbacteria bacterium]|nr:glycosyltransferase family 39 protein [Candidatus Curtissbacteria bacterium]